MIVWRKIYLTKSVIAGYEIGKNTHNFVAEKSIIFVECHTDYFEQKSIH